MEDKTVLIPDNTDLNYIIPKHRDVLPDLLNLIGPVDFRGLADLPQKETLKKKHFVICTIEEILRIAKAYNFGLARKYDFFYLYNGAYWQLLDDQQLTEFLGKAAEKMGVEKFDARHYQFRDELLKQFIASAHLQRPEATGTIINLLNGTLEIGDKARLRSFDPADFITYQLPYDYDPEATAPQFMQYLNEVLPDESAQRVISEFLGYVFIPNSHLKLEKALLLYGPGANGKSVFFEIVKALLGNENLSSYSLSSLTNETGYYRAEVANKLVNYASEINGNLEAARFKALVSGEPIEARKPYGQAFILQNYARLIFNTNELPRDVEHTLAFFRRFLIVPFNVTIPESRQDKELANKIIETELPGVFNWILEGLKRVIIQRNFSKCELAEHELKEFQKQSDSVQMFIEDQNLNPDPNEWTVIKEIYNSYRAYCYEDGYKPVGKKVFIKRLDRIGILTERKAPGMVAYLS